MGSLLRATTLFGYSDLVRELGGDPEVFLSRFRIPPGLENQEDAFISFDAYVRMLEASADDLGCPDFGLRLSHWQGLHTLGPIAVIARNAQTVLGGVEAIARYLYVHSPALKLTLAPRTAQTSLRFTYGGDRTGPSRGRPGLRDQHGDRCPDHPPARRSGGAADRDLVHARATGLRRGVPRSAGLPGTFPADMVRIRATPRAWPTDASRPRTRRLDASPRNTLSPITFRRARRCPERVAELTRRLLPTGQCSVDAIADQLAMHPRSLQRQLVMEGVRCQDLIERERRDPGGEIPRRTGIASQPDRGPARLRRTEHPQSLVPTLVREDTSPVPRGPCGAGYAPWSGVSRAGVWPEALRVSTMP